MPLLSLARAPIAEAAPSTSGACWRPRFWFGGGYPRTGVTTAAMHVAEILHAGDPLTREGRARTTRPGDKSRPTSAASLTADAHQRMATG